MNVNNNNNNNNNNHNNHSNSNGTSNGNINSNGKGGSFTSKAAVGGVLQPIALRIFLDHSMLEVFTSTGQVSGMNALLAVALLMCAVLPLLRIFNGGAGVYLNALCALAGLTTSSARTNTHRTYTHAHDHHLHVTLCANPDFPCLPLQGFPPLVGNLALRWTCVLTTRVYHHESENHPNDDGSHAAASTALELASFGVERYLPQVGRAPVLMDHCHCTFAVLKTGTPPPSTPTCKTDDTERQTHRILSFPYVTETWARHDKEQIYPEPDPLEKMERPQSWPLPRHPRSSIPKGAPSQAPVKGDVEFRSPGGAPTVLVLLCDSKTAQGNVPRVALFLARKGHAAQRPVANRAAFALAAQCSAGLDAAHIGFQGLDQFSPG
eukprot:1159747-Pelagomonas_calceolata.AAC.4